jgi:hypothetical protein
MGRAGRCGWRLEILARLACHGDMGGAGAMPEQQGWLAKTGAIEEGVPAGGRGARRGKTRDKAAIGAGWEPARRA